MQSAHILYVTSGVFSFPSYRIVFTILSKVISIVVSGVKLLNNDFTSNDFTPSCNHLVHVSYVFAPQIAWCS